MEDGHYKVLFEQVFGQSSDSEADDSTRGDDRSRSLSGQNPSWERIDQIKGLWLCRDFLSPQKQSFLLSEIQNEGWFTESSNNQAMRFGDLPAWATELSNSIHESMLLSDSNFDPVELDTFEGNEEACVFPSDLLWRYPHFDQLIVNVYNPGEGICAHVDLLRFEDGIAIVSLESSCVMHFTKVETSAGGIEKEGKSASPTTRIPILLTPGSLVLLSGEARYHWKHEINRKPGFQIWEGRELNQMRRTSVTLRKLCTTESVEPALGIKGTSTSLPHAHFFLRFLSQWHEGGLLDFLHSRYVSMKLRFALLISSSSSKKSDKSSSSSIKILTKEDIVTTMLVGNFTGIVCARSLHYQFYSCYSSLLLLCLHLIILWDLWSAPPEYPYEQHKSLKHKDKYKSKGFFPSFVVG